MSSRVLTRSYRKLGARYPQAYVAVELQFAFLVTLGTLLLFGFYRDPPRDEFIAISVLALGLTAVAIVVNLVRTRPLVKPIEKWIEGDRSKSQSAHAWRAAVALPGEMVRRDFVVPLLVVINPTVIAAALAFNFTFLEMVGVFCAAVLALGYGAVIHYLAIEAGMRPVLLDINQSVTPHLHSGFRAVSLRWRLLAALPLVNLITGIVVALLASGSNGVGISFGVLAAVAVATAVSIELTFLLSRSVLRPIADLQEATQAVRHGDLSVTVPVTTADELGGLAASFNHMVWNLGERERIRETLDTYLDSEVARYILEEDVPNAGMEVEVSVLFCDMRDFTAYAANLDAKEVVGTLNRLFEVAVPIVARYGGHIDSFEGDGFLAVFGAPEQYPDHPDRAVGAAWDLVRQVNDRGVAGDGVRIGIGINTGMVVAGAVGGAGRLTFSVIGDAVNVAARVESLTREIGNEPVLVTEATMRRLGPGFDFADRGYHELRGVSGPVHLFGLRNVRADAMVVVEADDSENGSGESDTGDMTAIRAVRALARQSEEAGVGDS